MVAVDTNVLVRMFVRDDDSQAGIADRFIEQGAWVSLVALAELVWVLKSTYKRTPQEIADVVEVLVNHKSLVLQDFDAVAAAVQLFRSRPAIEFDDCLILHLARKADHLPLGTFDRRLGRISGVHQL